MGGAARLASPHLSATARRSRPAAHPLWPSGPLSTLNSPVPRLGAWAWARPRDSTKRNPTRRSLPTEPTRPPRASPPWVNRNPRIACSHACMHASMQRTHARSPVKFLLCFPASGTVKVDRPGSPRRRPHGGGGGSRRGRGCCLHWLGLHECVHGKPMASGRGLGSGGKLGKGWLGKLLALPRPVFCGESPGTRCRFCSPQASSPAVLFCSVAGLPAGDAACLRLQRGQKTMDIGWGLQLSISN
jgi:hypothetical protein